MIYFQKYFKKLQVVGLMGQRGSISHCYILNRPKLFGRHIKSHSACMTMEDPVLMSCLIFVQSNPTFS